MSHKYLIGQIFGTLEVIGIGPTNKHRKKLLLVKCLKHSDVQPYHVVKQSLINGSTKGCEKCRREKLRTHGRSRTREYNIYKRIIQRIKDKNDQDYYDYGGRGINMDPRYDPDYNNQGITNAFLSFYNDIGDIKKPYTLDRKDNNKGYWKDNLRIVDMYEQAHNKRNTLVNDKIVKNIREDYQNGMSQKNIQIKYHLKRGNVRDIVKRRRWNNI